MSFLTGTNVELIYANTTAGTAKASFTSEVAINDTTGMGVACHLPPDFFMPNPTAVGKGLKIIARGILSSTGTPTYTWTIRSGTAGNTTAAILLGSAALTTGSGVTNQPWELEGDVYLVSQGAAGANSSVRGTGMLISPGLATTINGVGANASLTTPVATTFDCSITNFLNVNVTCSASSASNSIQLQSLQVYGVN